MARLVEDDGRRDRDLGVFAFVTLPRPDEFVSLTFEDRRREQIFVVIGVCHMPAPLDGAEANAPVREPSAQIRVRCRR